ncbi:MAG: GDSL family lipase [Nitrospirae bacterium]|nr:MAG: GDSL family lipase [Nitrospirota bacterium]
MIMDLVSLKCMARLLFIGDSLIEFFDWAGRFPKDIVYNLGVAGETVEGLHRRLERIFRSAAAVGTVLIMSGINNLAMDDRDFVPTYRYIVRELSGHYPSARIFVQSLLPVLYLGIANDDITGVNRLLKEMAAAEGAFYADIHSLFLGESGDPAQDLLSEDGVHLSDEGYRVWADEVERLIRRTT